MRLTRVSVRGIRRFHVNSSVRLTGQLIAFIGPNEAGKPSLLDALSLLNDDEPIPDRDVTRGADPNDAKIEAFFILDRDDQRALADVPGGADIKRCTVTKWQDPLCQARVRRVTARQ